MFAFPPKRTGAGGSEAQSLLQTSRAALTTTSWRLRGRPRAPVRRCPGQCIVHLSLAPSLFCFFSACRLSIICVSETSRPPPRPQHRLGGCAVRAVTRDTGYMLGLPLCRLPLPQRGPRSHFAMSPPKPHSRPGRPPTRVGTMQVVCCARKGCVLQIHRLTPAPLGDGT